MSLYIALAVPTVAPTATRAHAPRHHQAVVCARRVRIRTPCPAPTVRRRGGVSIYYAAWRIKRRVAPLQADEKHIGSTGSAPMRMMTMRAPPPLPAAAPLPPLPVPLYMYAPIY